MKRLNLLIFLLTLLYLSGLNAQKTNVYFFPGQGSDERIFQKINLDTTNYNCIYFSYPIPDKREGLHQFAMRFIDSLNQQKPYILIGTSLGGMICSELADTLKPSKTIIISSAKHRKELPHRYRFQRILPIYRVFPKRALLGGAKVMQPIVEPESKKHKEIFKSMLGKKDPVYMKRSIEMIIKWKRKECNADIIHIHGTKDHTIPYRKIDADISIQDGSHMMTLTKGEIINDKINSILSQTHN